MAAFDLRDRFDLAPLGALTPSTAWVDPAISSISLVNSPHTVQQLYNIVPEPLAANGFACRCLYPQGAWGTQGYYQVKVPSPGVAVNLEFMWRFESGFQLAPTTTGTGGKIGPCINWGAVNLGERCMFEWDSAGSFNAHPVFIMQVQKQASGGGQLLGPTYGPVVQVGRPYKLRVQVLGGATGFAKFWIDDVLYGNYQGAMPNTTLTDTILYDFNAFAGGGSSGSAPTADEFGTHWDLHMWSEPPQMAITQGLITLS